MQEHHPKHTVRLCLSTFIVCLVLLFTANVHGAPLVSILLQHLGPQSADQDAAPSSDSRPVDRDAPSELGQVFRRVSTLSLHADPTPVYRISTAFTQGESAQPHVASFTKVATARPEGYWHTAGRQILDSQNRPVRITGINWYGFETLAAAPHGLTRQDFRAILDTVRAHGYNTVRLPFSNEMVSSAKLPDIAFQDAGGQPINTELEGLTSLQIMDRVIRYAGSIGLRVILDNHRSEAGDGPDASGLWYSAAHPESAWINDWQTLARRYAGDPTVIGMDLRNEPHNALSGGSCWGCNTPSRDWRLAAQRAGDAILRVNPRLLIFVEGTDTVGGDAYWWGGNLEGVRYAPVHLSIPNHLVYSAHDYGPSEYAQPWFNSGTTPRSLAAVWTRHWAFISQENIAPVWLGEFGTANDAASIQSSVPGSEGQWFTSLVSFLAANKSLNWSYWAVNGDDRYGLLDARFDAVPASNLKQQVLASAEATQLAPSLDEGSALSTR